MNRIMCLVFTVLTCLTTYGQQTDHRPNILFCISDDQSFPHTSAYGTDWVQTPGFDRVAREGILFLNAYTPNAKCAPSRSCIITGRNSWQLEEAANHVPFFPEKFATYVEVLQEAGYYTGYTGKGWAPGDSGEKNGQKRNLVGPAFNQIKTIPPTRQISNIDYTANFKAFLQSNEENTPFCFWFGATEPHRRYEYGSGIRKGGKNQDMIDEVFRFWPDNDTVRTDLLDYAFEIEYFDQHLVRMLDILEQKDLLENTLVIVTSDNGMPFPRVKGQSYEYSHHMPLAMMWVAGIEKPGRTYEPFVSFTDFAPTFLDIANVDGARHGMQDMEGNSLVPVFRSDKDPHVREFMVIGKERHDMGRPDDLGFPVRGIIRDDFLYLINYKPDRWPSGNPETGYMNTDGSPTKTYILNQRRIAGESPFWDWSFGKKEAEELYHLAEDPDCIHNLANGKPAHREIQARLRADLIRELKAEKDPRVIGNGDVFDQYIYAEERNRDFYNRYMKGEDMKAGWINQSDIEKEPIVEKP